MEIHTAISLLNKKGIIVDQFYNDVKKAHFITVSINGRVKIYDKPVVGKDKINTAIRKTIFHFAELNK